MLGAPVGQLEFVQAELAKEGAEHEALLEMIVPMFRLRGCSRHSAQVRGRRAAGPLSGKGSPH